MAHELAGARALEEYRLDAIVKKLRDEKDLVHRRLVGEEEFERATLDKVRVRADERSAIERKHLKSRIEELQQELDKERKARRSAELMLSQVKQRLGTLEENKSKHVHSRIDAELNLKKEKETREKVASRKREVEERFLRLLQAYRDLVQAYNQLKQKYVDLKESKNLTTRDKIRISMQKVRDLFTQAEEDDPDRLPPIVANAYNQYHVSGEDEGEADDDEDDEEEDSSDAAAMCDFCGEGGVCKGFQCAPNTTDICICGHERDAHDFIT